MKDLHLVCLDVPIPPDYGAMIDVYHRCKALTELGYRVHLHCYEYGRGRTHETAQVAHKVYYYDRPKSMRFALHIAPFIVATRRSMELFRRLVAEEYPILWEGQHCTAFLGHPALAKRKQWVRVHNIEWRYYWRLAQRKGPLFDRLFFAVEALKLRFQEPVHYHADGLICVSSEDQDYYRKRTNKPVELIRSGFGLDFSVPDQEREDYALFHGNLSVAENEEAVLWILDAISEFGTQRKVVIAGKEPSLVLQERIEQQEGVTLIANPNGEKMQELIRNASDQLLISFQAAGLKLKVLISTATHNRCLATPEIVVGSGLETCCVIVRNKREFIAYLNTVEFPTQEELAQRHAVLREGFDVVAGARKIAGLLGLEEV